MKMAGGILGIIGGLFGVIAAGFTLFVGGVAASFDAHGANTVIGLGWGGLFFSFLALIFGATAFARPRGSGIGLIIVSILGMLLGGTIVALFMLLSLVGGILAMIAGKHTLTVSMSASGATSVTGMPQKKPRALPWVLGGILGLLLLLIVVAGIGHKNGAGDTSSASDAPSSDPLVALQNAAPSSLRPDGELAELFQIGGNDHTDIQRENKFKEIKGQVVAWCLPVYDVTKADDGYKVQTSGEYNIFGAGGKVLGTFVYITPRNDEERRTIEALKEKDIIAFKGIIDDETMRSFDITPAILQPSGACSGSVLSSQITPATAQNSAASQQLTDVPAAAVQAPAAPDPQIALSEAAAAKEAPPESAAQAESSQSAASRIACAKESAAIPPKLIGMTNREAKAALIDHGFRPMPNTGQEGAQFIFSSPAGLKFVVFTTGENEAADGIVNSYQAYDCF